MKKKPTPPPAALRAIEADHQRRLQAAQDSGDLDRAARLLSMAYLTFTEANCYVERANSLLEKHDMVHKKVKTSVNNLAQSFDSYNNVMRSLIGENQGALNQLCNDSDAFHDVLDAFMNHQLTIRRNKYYEPTIFLPSK